ncbi:NACHT domain-containing protein [Streptomyces sp. SLBN-118]|uniref:NACHT domain-containing protein n=1 Tax=Streptomyces sp. SLBN-118 TaxID=2768454 RepID=UPI001152D8FD|nr:NACHT domain-containing protein [Streptomyces sp. SLBN-118]TQK42523.1 NACHT domain-containing protein [Streptomyces sp. SLBN-118]
MSGRPGLQKPDPAEHKPDQSGGDRSVNLDGDNYGIVSTGDNASNVLILPAAHPAENSLAGKANLLADRVSGFLKREEEQQRLWDPAPLPVRWRPAPSTLTGRRNSILDDSAKAVATLPLDLTGPLERIAALYEGTKPGRLMVLGKAGSGKTILIRRFARARLEARTPTGEAPVPVIFSLGSWNPTTTPLRDWMIDRLERDHPFLAGVGPDGSTWADALVGADRVLAILDGFDEIADGLHEAALLDLRATTVPLLMTSRRAELEAAVGTTALFAGIELTDLTLDDSVNYLLHPTNTPAPHSTPRDGTDTATPTGWEHVLNNVRRHRDIPACANLAAVLTTPLMVTLAHTVYKSGRDPVKLLENEEFSTRGALEDHLLDNFIPTAYDRFLSNRPAAKRRPWRAERARHWLGYLATHLQSLDTHDIEWWRMGTAMSLSSRMLISGVTSGLVSGTMLGLVFGLTSEPREASVNVLLNVLGIGLVFGLMHGFGSKLKVGGAFEPSRMHIQIRGGSKRVKASFLPRIQGGLAGGLVFGVVFGLGMAVYAGLLAYPRTVIAVVFGNWLVVGLALGLAVGLILALMAGLEALIETKSSVSPWDLLNTNRTTVLTEVLAVGLAVGLGFGIVVALVNGFALGVTSGLATGLAVGLGLGTLTAWGRWVVLVRIWLPLTGRLPWAVNAFLDDAYQRGVLRQVGAVYQFRHARLRDRLAEVYKQHEQSTAGGR